MTNQVNNEGRVRRWPAVLAGAVAALIGCTVYVSGPGDPSWARFAVSAGATLLPACAFATYGAPFGKFTAYTLVAAGAAIGVAVHAMMHEALFDGSRNLWPFELVIFLALGAVPSIVGLFVGAALRRRGASPH